MSTDYRAELQRLLGAVENDVIDTNDGLRFQAAVNRARAALAQPEPEGVTDEEIGRCLIAAGVDAMEGESEETNRMYWEGWHEQIITGIRAVITADRARWSRPAIEPVPPTGFFPVEYADANGEGIRIIMEPADETGHVCWVVRNSRRVNPIREFPTPEAAYAAHLACPEQESDRG